jgi:large subunit ribosomal protein L10
MNRQEKAQIIEQLHRKSRARQHRRRHRLQGPDRRGHDHFRSKCFEAGVDYQVVKNTLARLALKDTDHGELSEHFKENCAIALGYDDPVALAKALGRLRQGEQEVLHAFRQLWRANFLTMRRRERTVQDAQQA